MTSLYDSYLVTDCLPSQGIDLLGRDVREKVQLQPWLEQFKTRKPEAQIVQDSTSAQPLQPANTNPMEKGPS
jgi:hypothetical protein